MHLDAAIPALKLLKQMLANLSKSFSSQRETAGKKLRNALVVGIDQFNAFYREMSEKLQRQAHVSSLSPELETFRQASDILCEVQRYAD